MSKSTLNANQLTAQSIKAGKLEDDLPEFYALKDVKENDSWHKKPSVFDHSVAVLENLERLINCHFLSAKTKKVAKRKLQAVVDNHTREQLLTIAVVIHDISKKDTLVSDSLGVTACPGYEIMASGMVEDFKDRFGLNKSEIEFIQRLVLYHGFAHDILKVATKRKNKSRYFRLLKKVVSDMYLELLIFAYADMLGSDIVSKQTADFRARETVLVQFLERGLKEQLAVEEKEETQKGN